ncbi:MAG TPA: hypothetical protein VHL53_18805 [Acidimicrobiia bacterium]|nr:hypothetical protein [Acidimicrobiia bacterium]
MALALSPFAFDGLTARAGADTASDCAAAFTITPGGGLTSTTDPPIRLAFIGQTVTLSGVWDPAAWDSAPTPSACVNLNDVPDETLGGTGAAVDTGAFDHSFVVPADIPQGSVLCALIRLAGDPAGPETGAVWVSKTHCFEVDTSDTPDTTDTTDTTAPAEAPPAPSSPTTTTAPAASGSDVSAPPTTPALVTGSPDNGVFAPEGGGGPPGTPVADAAPPPAPASPEAARSSAPMLPATGIATRTALHLGDALFFFGLAFVVLFGRPRRRRRPAG